MAGNICRSRSHDMMSSPSHVRLNVGKFGGAWLVVLETRRGTPSILAIVELHAMADQTPSGSKLQSTIDVRNKRSQVLARYSEFKDAARLRRERLEGARQFQQFRRDADELEAWINEKIQIVSDESYKDRTNLQVLTLLRELRLVPPRGWGLAANVNTYLSCCPRRQKPRSTKPLRQRQQHTAMPSSPSRAQGGP